MDGTLELSGGTLEELIGLVRQHTGIAMQRHKGALLQGRLGPRLRALAIPSYEHYLALLRGGGAEVQSFIDMVTTKDTLFFRTPAVWQYIGAVFLPEWYAANAGRCLRIWSAAAASGEEAWSLAIACDRFAQQHPHFRYQILGSDISAAALARARAGLYQGRSIERLGAECPHTLAQYFRPQGEGMAVIPALRLHVQFSAHNLLQPFAVDEFDLVLLRNVLIYFDEENQRRVLEQVRARMLPHARLVLGEQESVARHDTALEFERQHVYRRGAP